MVGTIKVSLCEVLSVPGAALPARGAAQWEERLRAQRQGGGEAHQGVTLVLPGLQGGGEGRGGGEGHHGHRHVCSSSRWGTSYTTRSTLQGVWWRGRCCIRVWWGPAPTGWAAATAPPPSPAYPPSHTRHTAGKQASKLTAIFASNELCPSWLSLLNKPYIIKKN